MPSQQELQTNKKKVGLATLFSGLVILSVLLTLTILLIASYQSKKQALYDTTLNLNFNNAAKMSQTMDSLFKSMRSGLQYTASMLKNSPATDEEELFETLELMRLSSNYFNSVFLIDETGLIRSRSPYADNMVGTRISTETALEAVAVKKPYLSQAYTSARSNRLIVFMSEPIYDKNGTYRGVIGGSIYLQEPNIMNMIFGSNNIDAAGSSFYIVGSDGHLLYHPDKSRLGEDISANTVVQKLMQGKSGQERFVSLTGIPLLAGYSYVPENGWGVVVTSSVNTIQEQLEHHIQLLLLKMLLPFILLLLAAIWLARKLARPFVSLADLVSRIGKEEVQLPEMKNHWNREADLLTKAITAAFTDIKKQTEQLTRDAMTDPLTGLTNRRTLESVMNKWTSEAVAYSIMVMDIDRFKKINDTYGHQAGDEVLKQLSQIITLYAKPGDVCCRYGGEEFVMLLALTTLEDAYQTAENIRLALDSSVLIAGEQITVSVGIAHYPTHSEHTEALFQLADQALYIAKETGRNRTIVADVDRQLESI
ncbi:sensor domain-containing diguanylate cyclase [Paenibacillus sinopodophylli]|uniref:sensor domain-containing diguanylate cyclase n=1 Tax=Paenibacillus sinopodophylli TaxID=1837342 RepID=UPI00110CF14E|nr:sensor domain-containing diguanylate cyclase [Paenibacillus sinopodophylli]